MRAKFKTPYYGENLDGLLRVRESTLSGILNGIDYTIFDPSTDRFLTHHFDSEHPEGKQKCKRAPAEGMRPRGAGRSADRFYRAAFHAEGARFDRTRAGGYPPKRRADRVPRQRRPAVCGPAQLGELALPQTRARAHRAGRRPCAPHLRGGGHVPHAEPVRTLRAFPDDRAALRRGADCARNGRAEGYDHTL